MAQNYKVIDRRGERKEGEEASTVSSPKPSVVPPAPKRQEATQTKQTVELLYDRVLIFPDADEEVTASGLVIQSEAREMRSGVVVGIGFGRVKDNGEVLPLWLKPSDRV